MKPYERKFLKLTNDKNMSFLERNLKHRMEFVKFWADYVRTHDDKDWSKQQNILINSCLQGANMTKEHFLEIKKAGRAARNYSEPNK